MFTEIPTKLVRLRIYKGLRKELLKEKRRRKSLLRIHDEVYPKQINFCKIIRNVSIIHGILDLPELMEKAPSHIKDFFFDYWFDPVEIEPRLQIINEVISEFHISLLDILLKRH